ncbi:hypothetical protein C2E23DRAFT_95007 [Lenzites betulinus]|nr:hypothetical protein C2E23DRAFT_95007 [Lenzites betulinus]
MPLTPSVALSCARSQQRRQSSGVPPVLVSRRPLSVCISPMLHPPCCAPAHPTTPIPRASCIPTAHQRAPPSKPGCTSSFRAPRSAAVYHSHTRPPQPHYTSATSPHNTRSQAGIIHRSVPRPRANYLPAISRSTRRRRHLHCTTASASRGLRGSPRVSLSSSSNTPLISSLLRA